jgi:hypothetical protein
MSIKKDLPVYRVEISENDNSELEVNFIALVDRPAIQKNFLAFSEDANKFKFKVVSKERRIISGPLMLADTPIYRYNPHTKEEYYTVFDAETIYKIAQKFFRKGYQTNVNLMHEESQQVHGVVLFESFITDEARGIMPMKGFEDAPAGSWFGSMLVEDAETWEKIEAGDLKGFSVEGFFSLVREKRSVNSYSSDEHKLEEIKRLLNLLNETD